MSGILQGQALKYLNNLMKSAERPGLWANIRAKKKRGESPAKPGDKDYPDRKQWQKLTAKKADAPAWQRSEGKNPEGGLNAKGRASYKRETGGTLKAPVTESNPKGERAKRQNSFCSRMCGMKRVNTGGKAKRDPDSRINKSLRKWNCKCGETKVAAYNFGGKAYDYLTNLNKNKAGVSQIKPLVAGDHMLKESGIFRAPKHVQEAWLNNPLRHKLLSSAGGKARARALLKAKNSIPLKQTEFDFNVPASSVNISNPRLTPEEAAEGFRLLKAMLQKESTAKLAYDPIVDSLVVEADRRLANKKSLGWADPQALYNEVNLTDAQIKKIIRKVRSKKDQRNRKILATLLGGAGGAVSGAVISRNPVGVLVGAGVGGLGINRLQAHLENSANKLTDEKLKKAVGESMQKINERKKDKVNQAVGSAYTLTGAAALPAALTEVGALAATIGGASALPELTDTQMEELIKNAPIKNKQNLRVHKPTNRNIFANAYYNPSDHSVQATSLNTWKPGIMAHELGHAELQGSKGVAGWLQRHAYTPTTLLNTYGAGLPTSIATYLATKNDDDVSTGALKGLATGTVANAGILVPEFEASRRGIANLLKSTQLSKGQKLLNSLSLAPAFLTYLAGTAGVQAGVGGLNAYYNRKRKEKESKLYKSSQLKTAKSHELLKLIEAKKKSDARDFTSKNHIIQTLTHKNPTHFKVDSRLNRNYVGLTHIPSGFKIHAPKKILPAAMLG